MENGIKAKYFRQSHKIYIDNLNQISKDLIKAKWLFLASIGSIGLGYYYAINISANFNYIMIISLFTIANIISWLIGEYILSHGFLFRFNQVKIAKAERYFGEKTRDPSLEEYFLKKIGVDEQRKLFFDYFIPDQFVPLYWASVWAIILNTFTALSLIKNLLCNLSFFELVFCPFLSLFLISKIWIYYTYKLNKFINDEASFKIYFREKNEDSYFYHFDWKTYLIYFCSTLFIVIFIMYAVLTMPFNIYHIPIISLISFFWFTIMGLALHVLKILPINIDWSKFSPIFEKDGEDYIGNFKIDMFVSFKRVCCFLFSVV